MAAYVLARVNVTDAAQYREYLKVGPAVIAKFGGRVLARTDRPVALEGDAGAGRWVLIEFPSADRARAFYASPEYQEARRLREGAATGSLILIEGS